MNYRFIYAVLAATVLSLGANAALANDDEDAAARERRRASHKADAQKAQKAPAAAKSGAAQPKAAAKRVKPVDINSANKAALKKLPGIGDAEADKIIAGRPYGSKTWLVSDNIIPEGIYLGIAGAIEAKQPFKDGPKNVEYLKKAAEKKAAEQKAGDKK